MHKSHKTLCRALCHCAYAAVLTLVSRLRFPQGCGHRERPRGRSPRPPGSRRGKLCAGSPCLSNCCHRRVYSVLRLQRNWRQRRLKNMLGFPLFPDEAIDFHSSVSLSQTYPEPCQSFKLKAGLRRSTFQRQAVMQPGCWKGASLLPDDRRNLFGPGRAVLRATYVSKHVPRCPQLLGAEGWIPTTLYHGQNSKVKHQEETAVVR